jgi:hypothetical protein
VKPEALRPILELMREAKIDGSHGAGHAWRPLEGRGA